MFGPHRLLLGALTLLLLWHGPAAIAHAANRDVCPTCPYASPYYAYLAANSGDTIRIASGTFFEGPQIGAHAPSVAFEGGYNSDFTARDGETIFSGLALQLSPSFVGSISFDRITFINSPSAAIYLASTRASLSVTNCRFVTGSSQALIVRPYYPLPEYPFVDYRQRASASFVFSDNDVLANDASSAIEFNSYVASGDPYTVSTIIERNTIRGAESSYGAGIRFTSSGQYDTLRISSNDLSENTYGAYLHFAAPLASVAISGNRIHHNISTGVYLFGGNNVTQLSFSHNLVEHAGINLFNLTRPGTAEISNNVFAYSSNRALVIYGASGSPSIRNNVFYQNAGHPIYIAGAEGSWSGTAIVPSELKHNVFYSTLGGWSFTHISLAPAYSYHSEIPGAWDDINQFPWSAGNIREHPQFVDPENGNFALASHSLLIDEGNPDDDFGDEPNPHGNQINIGLTGNTPQAESAAALPALTNLSAEQIGEQIVIRFDLSTSLSATWLLAEYWNGSAYLPITPETLTSSDYRVGYRGGRITTGSARQLLWTAAATTLAGERHPNMRVRITVLHGQRSAQYESSAFPIDFGSPTVGITSPSPNSFIPVHGSAILADATGFRAGISSVIFEYRRDGDSTFTTIGSDSSAPFNAAWPREAALIPGARYLLRARAIDGANNSYTSSEIAVSVCGQQLSASAQQFSATSQDAAFTVTSNGPSCVWSVQTNADWITPLANQSGAGTSTLNLRLSENTGSARSTTVNIGSSMIQISQAAADCHYNLSLSTNEHSAVGGSGLLIVDATHEGCSWTLAGVPDWISITDSLSGTGDKELQYHVVANNSSIARQAAISLGNQELPLNQLGLSCQFAVTISRGEFDSTSESGELTISTSAEDCAWTLASAPSWVSFLSATSGIGSGSVSFALAENQTYGSRTSTISVAGQNVLLTQRGKLPPPLLTTSVNRLGFTGRILRKTIILRNTSARSIHILGIGLASRLSGLTFSGVKRGTVIRAGKGKTITLAFNAKRGRSYSNTLRIISTDPNRALIEIPITGLRK